MIIKENEILRKREEIEAALRPPKSSAPGYSAVPWGESVILFLPPFRYSHHVSPSASTLHPHHSKDPRVETSLLLLPLFQWQPRWQAGRGCTSTSYTIVPNKHPQTTPSAFEHPTLDVYYTRKRVRRSTKEVVSPYCTKVKKPTSSRA